MTDKALKFTKCQISKINFTHTWNIPKFAVWIKENKGKWLDGCLFSPAQGIQLQIKILTTIGYTVLIFLKNCSHIDVPIANWTAKEGPWLENASEIYSGCSRYSDSEGFVLGPNKLSENIKFAWMTGSGRQSVRRSSGKED